MKIRIKGDFIRFRLTRSEVDEFGRTGYIEEKIHFGPGKEQVLTYALKAQDEVPSLQCEYSNNKIVLQMPKDWACHWTNSEKVGYESSFPLGDGTTLQMLLEKDFKCLDNTMEDQSDNYPNPLAEKK